MKRVCRQKPSTFWSYKFLSVYRIFLSFQTNASIFRSVYRLFTTQWYCGLTYCNPLCHFNFISAWLNTTLAHYLLIYPLLVKVKQAWSGPEGSRKLRFSDFMTTAQDGGKFSRRHRPPLSPENVPGTHFCQRLNRPQGHNTVGRIISVKNSSDTIGNRTRHLPACSVPPSRCTRVRIRKTKFKLHDGWRSGLQLSWATLNQTCQNG